LGGVCRVTISLVVIMFGLTSALQLIVPFMLAILTAKFVGDLFGEGIYDAHIVLRGYPYLHEPHEVSFKARACDVMDDDLECLNCEPSTIGDLRQTLKSTKHGGFPLIRSELDPMLLGYVHTKPLLEHLDGMVAGNALLDDEFPVIFKKYAKQRVPDETFVRIVPETPLGQVHRIFRQLGVKLVLVTRFGYLAGMITKKAFVDHLQEGRVGHIAVTPAVTGEPCPPIEEEPEASLAKSPRGPALDGGVAAPLLQP